MSNAALGLMALFLFLILLAAHLLGQLAMRLRQPKVAGEILAGIVLGPFLFGRVVPAAALLPGEAAPVMDFLYQAGLLLLMFLSGTEAKMLFHREDRREVAWLGIIGTGFPFVLTLCVVPFVSLEAIAGRVKAPIPLLLVVGIAVAVTSIPVISKILHDLRLLNTRFARLVLGVAVIEDTVLWALLAVATALATAGTVPKGDIAAHVAITLVYFAFGLLPAPKLIHASAKASWNILAKASPIAYTMLVLLAYTAVAAMLNVNIAFAAFLAGLGIVARNAIPAEVFRPVSDFSFAVFIPIYFALVGYRLDLSGSFSFAMLAIFLVASSGVKILSAWTGARMAGFHNQEALNLAVALNARGGPGIVLASVALGAGIINAAFHTTLVLTAVLTSQAAGVWLGQLVRTGGPLLSPGRSGSTVLAPGSA